jgi:hypothetical protein
MIALGELIDCGIIHVIYKILLGENTESVSGSEC